MAIFISDLTRSKEEILLDLINRDNGSAYKVGDFMYDPPVVNDSPNRNTAITVYGTVPGRVFGTATLTYNRPDIAALPGQESLAVWAVDMQESKELIPMINRVLNINLGEGDFVNETLPSFEGLPKGSLITVSLVMTLDNPIYRGVLSVRIHN